MQIKEIREKPVAELRKEIEEQRQHYRELRFKVVAKQVKNIKELNQVRKGIAQRLTVLKEKESAESK